MRSFMIALLACCMATTAFADAAIIPGTILSGQLQDSISSHTAQVGDWFVLTDVRSANGHLAGARIRGHIASVIRAGQGRNAQIRLAYDTLISASGHRYRIYAQTVQLNVQTKNNALKEAGGALAGMLAGNYLGKVMGTNIGGSIGLAGGFLAAKNNRADVDVPANSTVELRVDHSSNL